MKSENHVYKLKQAIMKNKDYKCVNGAYHDSPCCDTCWNNHPAAKEGEMFLGSDEQKEISKYIFYIKSWGAGFTREQTEFLFELIK